MIIKYDIEKINRFLYDFYHITGVTVSIWDAEMNRLSFKPDIMPDFCRLVTSSSLGRSLCLQSDLKVCSLCQVSRTPVSRKCHAGLTDTAIPLILNNRLFGYMMFGQVRGEQDHILTVKDVERLATQLSLPPKELYAAYTKLGNFNLERINSTANILTSAVSYLFDSGSIHYTDSELITELEKWIADHISLPFRIDEIYTRFGISKNKLYLLWEKHFHMTVGQYILEKKMRVASKLLLNSNRKISDICNDIGIYDYNYFTKVFKKYYGMTPRDYRKMNS